MIPQRPPDHNAYADRNTFNDGDANGNADRDTYTD